MLNTVPYRILRIILPTNLTFLKTMITKEILAIDSPMGINFDLTDSSPVSKERWPQLELINLTLGTY